MKTIEYVNKTAENLGAQINWPMIGIYFIQEK